MSDYYKIYTSSVSTVDASITIQKYKNNSIEYEETMVYTEWLNVWKDFDGLFRVMYDFDGSLGIRYTWVVEIIGGIKEYSGGEVFKWMYNVSANYTLTCITIANYDSVADIVAGVENATQLVANTKYDDNSYTISDVPDYVKYKGASVSTIYAPIKFVSEVKYLVRDGNTIYTVTDGMLSVVEGDLTANLFISSGVDTIPDGSLLLPLYAPEVLCWTDGEELPRITATVQGVPTGTHEIISDNINIGDSSIHGVSSIVAVASSGAKFFLAFDGGSWVVYDTSNNTWVASDTGMTAEELAAIPVSAWQGIVDTVENMLLKAVISGSETVTQIKFIFEN